MSIDVNKNSTKTKRKKHVDEEWKMFNQTTNIMASTELFEISTKASHHEYQKDFLHVKPNKNQKNTTLSD